MTELETLLLRQLQQQQHDSETLVGELSEQLERLQTALSEQRAEWHAENRELRRELQHSDRANAELIERLTARVDALTTLLNDLRMPSSR
jgi:predicted  nucleic acid-binding Zn-ribbon protein